MAGQPTSAPTAAQVGKAFVGQYYNVLHNSPHIAHRFYTDASRITRAEFGPDGVVDTVVTQAEIHEKIVSFDYGECKAEIKTVDSQASLSGSVLVLVTGALSRNNMKRNFVQSFFLAPQEKGYYVLNDIYRYLDEEPHPSSQTYAVPNGGGLETTSEIPADPQQEDETRDFSPSPPPEEEVITEDWYEPADHTEVSEAEEDAVADDPGYEEVAEVAANEPASTEVEPPPVTAEDMPMEKKSYASILLVKKENGAAASSTPSTVASSRPVQEMTEQPAPSQETAAPTPQSPALIISDKFEDNAHTDSEVDSRSIYVKNLPTNITSSQLEVEFSRFGRIKPGSVNVRSQKQGACYGFVEFEDPMSAQSAIEASPIPICGRPAYVEEKRPMSARVVRGRAPQGRGFFRNDGGRGRGSYGRGFTRGAGQDRDYRARGSGPMRGSYGVSNSNYFNNFNGSSSNFYDYHRLDVQGINVNRPPRRGAGNQMSRAAGTGSAAVSGP